MFAIFKPALYFDVRASVNVQTYFPRDYLRRKNITASADVLLYICIVEREIQKALMVNVLQFMCCLLEMEKITFPTIYDVV